MSLLLLLQSSAGGGGTDALTAVGIATGATTVGTLALAQMVFFAAQDLSAGASGVGSFKTALKLMGLARSHHMARPNRPLPPAAVERVRQHLVAHGLLAA